MDKSDNNRVMFNLYKGRINRIQYLAGYASTLLLGVGSLFLWWLTGNYFGSKHATLLVGIPFTLWLVIILILFFYIIISLDVRRLHDLGRSWVSIFLIFILGPLFVIYLASTRGDRTANIYGDIPSGDIKDVIPTILGKIGVSKSTVQKSDLVSTSNNISPSKIFNIIMSIGIVTMIIVIYSLL